MYLTYIEERKLFFSNLINLAYDTMSKINVPLWIIYNL